MLTRWLTRTLAAAVAFSAIGTFAQTITVVEYRNKTLDAYFITGRASEQAALDAVPDFERTGMTFVATPTPAATSAQVKICRFYVSLTQPYTSSHFYGREVVDCEPIQAMNPAGFTWEGYDFAVAKPEAGCAFPIYRGFRAAANGKTPNHRYTRSLSEYNAMIVLGWTGEGVAYCSSAAQYPVAESARAAAVRQTATQDAACAVAAPFYYEIGDRDGARASGSVGLLYNAATVVPIASASKWLYGAYVTQQRGGALTTDDVRFLTFTSGYVTFTSCEQTDTVGSCAVSGSNGNYTAAADGKYLYAGSHMQTHANRFTHTFIQ